MLTCSEASAVRVTDALLEFHRPDFEQVGVDGRSARETEPSLDSAEIRIVGQQPRCPGGDFLRFRTRVYVTCLVINATSGTVGSAVLRRRAVAASQARPEASAARSGAFAPVTPVGPLSVDRRHALDWTRWVAGAINLIAVGADAKAATERRLRITA